MHGFASGNSKAMLNNPKHKSLCRHLILIQQMRKIAKNILGLVFTGIRHSSKKSPPRKLGLLSVCAIMIPTWQSIGLVCLSPVSFCHVICG